MTADESTDNKTSTEQLLVLSAHRQRLALLIAQQDKLGLYTPPHVYIDIQEAQADIGSIKKWLREHGTLVEDHPDDERQIQVETPMPPALHQLRAPVGDFVGRECEIDQLVDALSKAATSGTAAAISGVRGMGGIGKTELAYVVASRLKDIFPDAQLLVELRGASSSPLTPEQALKKIISLLAGIREEQLPNGLDQLQGIYRSLLTGKQALILADDAEGKKQVQALMPPPGCALLVTSRNRFSLRGMVALDLKVLSPAEAEALLREVCPRIGEHGGELAKLCGFLPLALEVSASLLSDNNSRDVRRYLEQLRAERLKYLTDPDNPDDPQTSVEASLQLSYDALTPASQSALCQMSVLPVYFNWGEVRAVVFIKGDMEEMLPVARPMAHRRRVVFIKEDLEEVLALLERRGLLKWDATTKRGELHELVREFAAARLDNWTEVYSRFLRYYSDFYQLLLLEKASTHPQALANIETTSLLALPTIQAIYESYVQMDRSGNTRRADGLLQFYNEFVSLLSPTYALAAKAHRENYLRQSLAASQGTSPAENTNKG